MLHRIRTYIYKYRLLNESEPVIVGLSGGADSVALLNILIRLGYTCIAAHCNFHLRGEESGRDARFSEQIAEQNNIPFEKIDFNTSQYAGDNKLSVEMAARELRYRWFEEIRLKHNSQAIAVAHHRDDSMETFLLNVIRGTGIHGLTGIHPKNGMVVRPLLCLSKEDILNWLEERQLPYIIDSTNLSDEYTRNYIRLNLLPVMERINPSVKETMARTVNYLSEAEVIYNSVIEQARINAFICPSDISIKTLLSYPSPSTVLYELLKPYNFTPAVSDSVFLSLEGESGKEFYSSSHRLIKDRDTLQITSLTCKEAEGDTYYFTPGVEDGQLPVEFHCESIAAFGLQIEKDKSIAYFDADKLQYPLLLRRWRDGDWFIPFGMTGKKKISDYFSDNKFSLLRKENTWILCNGEDIIWIVGERADNRYRVSGLTKKVLAIKILGKTLL